MNKKYVTRQELENEECEGHMSPLETIITAVIMILFLLFYYGCGGGGSHHDSTAGPGQTPSNVIEGVFIDSPVEGLNYQTPTHTGITDAQGHFWCLDNEMVTFMLGDIMLGQAMASEVITPLDFLDESAVPYDVTNPMVTNMGRFLQSLDTDGDPENGITITDAVRMEISGRMIDFHQSVESFENDPDVIACFNVLSALDMPHHGMMWGLVPVDQARQHMNSHMGEYMDGLMRSDTTTNGDTGGSAGSPMMQGTFIDSPVEGLNYQTPTLTGITDAQGHFWCLDDEMVTFMLGDIMLGQAIADDVITPLDFLDESALPHDVTNPMVTNMGRFLQSLDADGNPENGITITDEVRNEISGRMIDFHQSVADFENDPDVVACFNVLNDLGMPHHGMMWELAPTGQAWQHMNSHMGEYMDEYMGFDSPGDENDKPEGENGDPGYNMMSGNMGPHM